MRSIAAAVAMILAALRRPWQWVTCMVLAAAWVSVALAAPPAQDRPKIEITDRERAWLAVGHKVRARVADAPPYMFQSPTPEGISVDLLAAAAQRAGFAVEFVSDTVGFAAAMRDVAGPRDHFDVLLTFTRTPEREKLFALTGDYLSAPWVIFARRDSPYIGGLDSLGGKTIAAENGYVISSKLEKDYPAIRLLLVDKSVDALVAVATGKADAYVGNLATASFLIKNQHLDNLVVAAPTPYGINTQAMAVRSDWPELASLIDKGIAAMTMEEHSSINRKWSVIEVRPLIDRELLWKVVLVATLVTLGSMVWSRRHALKSIRASESRLHHAEEVAKSGNWEFHLDDKLVFASPGARRIYGLQGEDFDLGVAQSVVLPEYRESLDARLNDLIARGTPYEVEFRIRTANSGEIKDIQSRAYFDASKRVVFGVLQDVTERKALELETRRDAAIIASSQDAIIGMDPNGIVTRWNPGAAAMLGYSADEMIGRPSRLLYPPNRGDETDSILNQVRAGTLVRHFDSVRVAKNGDLVDVSVSISPILDDAGAIIGASKILRDITANRRAAKALQASDEFARSTIDAMLEHICVIDRHGTVVAVNRAWRDFYDRNSTEAARSDYGIGVNYLELCRGASGPSRDEAPRMESGIRQVIEGECEVFSLDYPCDSPNEQRTFRARVVRFHGSSGNVLITHENITERKKRDAELATYRNHLEALVGERTAALTVAKEAAEAANRAKTTFLANMSHELMTPMNGILGLTHILAQRTEDPKSLAHLQNIEHSGRNLVKILQDILDIARIEADHVTLEESTFRVGDVVEKITAIHRAEADKKGLQFVDDVSDDTRSLVVLGDALRFGQILSSLLANAVKFTTTGSITLRCRPSGDDPSRVVLNCEVRDTGLGILPEQQMRLFRPFEQLDSSTTRQFGGAGLGLAICKSLVAQMGGSIGVNSEHGVGSTFWFSVQMRRAAARA